jgi:hypothetical protein
MTDPRLIVSEHTNYNGESYYRLSWYFYGDDDVGLHVGKQPEDGDPDTAAIYSAVRLIGDPLEDVDGLYWDNHKDAKKALKVAKQTLKVSNGSSGGDLKTEEIMVTFSTNREETTYAIPGIISTAVRAICRDHGRFVSNAWK